jgi:hypothetical protein
MSAVSTVVPLMTVLSFTALKDAIEDFVSTLECIFRQTVTKCVLNCSMQDRHADECD